MSEINNNAQGCRFTVQPGASKSEEENWIPTACQSCELRRQTSGCDRFKTMLIPRLAKEIQETALNFFDYGTRKTIAGDLITSVHMDEDGVILFDLHPDWWTKWHAIKVETESNPVSAAISGNDGEDPDVRALVSLLRELSADGQLGIFDPTSGFTVPSAFIESICANGRAVQITLDDDWHGYRMDLVNDRAEEAAEEAADAAAEAYCDQEE